MKIASLAVHRELVVLLTKLGVVALPMVGITLTLPGVGITLKKLETSAMLNTMKVRHVNVSISAVDGRCNS